MRNGIASLLRAHGHEVVAEANDGQEALTEVEKSSPDLILMDIEMPVMGGLEATRLIKTRHPDAKIVMLTVSDDENDLFEAVKSGAHGYLLKDLESSEAIGRGEGVIPARLAGSSGCDRPRRRRNTCALGRKPANRIPVQEPASGEDCIERLAEPEGA